MSNLPKINVKVTSVKDDETHIKGFANAIIADSFAINGIAVVDGKNGLFASLPKRSYLDENKATQYREICSPITAEARDALNDKVVDAYKEYIAQNNASKEKVAESENEVEVEDESEDIADDLDEDDGLVPVQ
jgi:stage V sporulation protein G